MAGRLEGTRIVVTGASRGLGRALAEGFAREGARLVVTATRIDHLFSVVRACAGAAEGVPLDLRDGDAIPDAAARAIATLGRVDVLVSNASLLGVRQPLADYPIDVWREVIEVGLTGTLRLIQNLLPGMADGGAIVNVTSGATGRRGWGAYAIAKLGIEGITSMLRDELADREIRCVAVNPGPARTSLRAVAYPDEDPATVPHPSSRVEAFIRIAEGLDPGPRVEADDLTG